MKSMLPVKKMQYALRKILSSTVPLRPTLNSGTPMMTRAKPGGSRTNDTRGEERYAVVLNKDRLYGSSMEATLDDGKPNAGGCKACASSNQQPLYQDDPGLGSSAQVTLKRPKPGVHTTHLRVKSTQHPLQGKIPIFVFP